MNFFPYEAPRSSYENSFTPPFEFQIELKFIYVFFPLDMYAEKFLLQRIRVK